MGIRTVIMTAALCLVSAAAARAALTGTVTVNGAVPVVCGVIVTPAAGAANIADISAGDTDRAIATVNETCNDPDGYTLTVVGTNSGNSTGRFRDSVSLDTHDFTIKYNGNAVPVGGVVTDVNAPGINLNRTVQITYPADPTLTSTAAFTYAETLTFTIAAK